MLETESAVFHMFNYNYILTIFIFCFLTYTLACSVCYSDIKWTFKFRDVLNVSQVPFHECDHLKILQVHRIICFSKTKDNIEGQFRKHIHKFI